MISDEKVRSDCVEVSYTYKKASPALTAPDAPLLSFELNGVTVIQSGGDFVGDSGDINLVFKNFSKSLNFIFGDTSCEEVKAIKTMNCHNFLTLMVTQTIWN